MPFASESQRKLIYAKAAEGVPWAIKFLEDMGLTPPTVKHSARRKAA
jgi:hypothetical protein